MNRAGGPRRSTTVTEDNDCVVGTYDGERSEHTITVTWTGCGTRTVTRT